MKYPSKYLFSYYASEKKIQFPAWSSVLCLAGAFWITASIGMTQSIDLSISSLRILMLASLIFTALFVVLLIVVHGKILGYILIGICLGLCVAFYGALEMKDLREIAQTQGYSDWDLRALEDSKEGEFAASCLAEARLANGHKVKVRVILPDEVSVDCWSHIRCSGTLRTPQASSANYYWSKGCIGYISPEEVAVNDPSGFIGEVVKVRRAGVSAFDSIDSSSEMSSDARVLMKAILFGDRRELFSSDLYSKMRTVGLAHIVAVSGAHLVIITGFFIVVLQAIGVPKHIAIPIQISFVIVYACLTGIPISVLRASFMTICAIAAFFAKRRSASINALCLCVIGVISTDPFSCLSISFALSACASLGIMLLSPIFKELFIQLFHEKFLAVSNALSVCCSANAFTLPISIPVFGQLPLIAPLSNLIAAPVFPFIVCYGMIAALLSLLFPGITLLVMLPLRYIVGLFCSLVRILASIPFSNIAAHGSFTFLGIIAACLTGVLIMLYKKHGNRSMLVFLSICISAIIFMLVVIPFNRGAEVIMIDVGQGDAIVVRNGSKAVLFDTGTNDAQLLQGLSRHGIRRLDAVVISHPDDDHCGSFSVLRESVEFDTVCVAKGVLESDSSSARKLKDEIDGLKCVELSAGDSFSLESFSFHVLSPASTKSNGSNEESLVIMIEYDQDNDEAVEWSILLTGDAESDSLEKLFKQGLISDVDILKVPHHGSKVALNNSLLEVLEPEIALISVGENNRYGHPSNEMLTLLNLYGCKVFRTDTQGDIVCKLGRDSIKVY